MASTQTIIINSDGSIKQRVLGEYINQGNDLVDTIYIGFVDDTIASSYVGTANFELPNGDTNTLVGTYVSGITLPNDTTNYKGYKIVLTQAQTIYNGQLKMSFVVTNGEEILYSYKTTFTINASVVAADEEKITLAQWNSLVNNLATYQVAYNEYNVRGYSSQEKATSDYENLDTEQISLFSDGSNLYYFKGGEDDLSATKIANYDDISKVSNALPITGGTMQGDIDMNAKSLTNVSKVAFAPSVDLGTIAELRTEIDGENAYLKLYSKYINVSSLACQMNWLVDGGIEFYKSISANKGITNLPAPTNDSDAVNKEYVDDNFATKVQLTSGQVVPMKSGAATYDSSGFNISQTYATKTYVNEKLSSVYVYKGSVASYSKLPISGLTTGDVYNVEDTGMNYAWTGSKWDALGSTIDTSAFVLKAGDTMSGNLKVDEIDNTNGNALVRYKSAESKNVFGGSNYGCVLMGNGTRPYYSNNGSDFSGNELALKSDIDTKQDTLVSGTNIKTINNQSLLGSGNISITGVGVIELTSPAGTLTQAQYQLIINGSAIVKITKGDYIRTFAEFHKNTTNVYSYSMSKLDEDNQVVSAFKFDITISTRAYTCVEYSQDLVDKTYVDESVNNLREVAEGKCKSIVMSYSSKTITSSNFASSSTVKFYKPDGTQITTWEEFCAYINKSSSETSYASNNSTFNTQNDAIQLTIDSNYWFVATNGSGLGYTIYPYNSNNDGLTSSLKNGDIILITEADVPDRWLHNYATGIVRFWKLDTAKVDVSGFATKDEVIAKQDTLVSGTNIKTINNQSLLGSGNISISGGSGGSDTYFIDIYFGNQKRTQPSAHITSRGLSSAEVDYFKTTITNYVNAMIGGGSLSYENAVKYICSAWHAGSLDVAKKNTILCKLVFLLQGIFGEMTFYRCLSSDSGNTLQIVSQTSYIVFILDISASDSPEYISMVTYLSNASLNISGITIDTDSNFINYIE